MLNPTHWRFILFTLVLTLVGCETVPVRINVVAVKSEGVDHIPSKLGIYPFLSTPLSGGGSYTLSEARLQSSLSVSKMGENVAITPAANSDMWITQESQIMTDLLSTNLSSYGFALKQLPVEMQDDKNTVPNKPKGFYISMDLLNDLRTNYGIETIALCDAFFILQYNPGAAPEKKVVSAHVKIVDTKTLDVLAQIDLPYVAEGSNLNDIAAQMAESLAKLANMDTKSKAVSQ